MFTSIQNIFSRNLINTKINLYLFLLLGFSLSFGQLFRISIFQQMININIHELLMIIIILINWRKALIVFTHRYFIITIAFITFSFIVKFDSFSLRENLFALLFTLRMMIWFIWIWQTYFIYRDFTLSSKKITKYFGMIFAISILTSSILQYFLLPTLVNFSTYGWDPHTGRIFGVMFDTGAMGAVLIMMSIFIYGYSNLTLTWVISLMTIIATYSRSSYITLIIILFNIKKVRNNIIFQLLFTSIFIIFILASFQKNNVAQNIFRTFSISSRINDQIESLVLIKNNWLTGVGIGRIRYVRSLGVSERKNIFDEYAHHLNAFASSWLTLWTWLGTLAMIWILYLIKIFYGKINNIQKLTFLTVGIMSLFDNILFQSLVMGLMGWYLIIEID